MTKQILTFLLGILVLTGCSQSDQFDDLTDLQKDENREISDNLIPLDEAIELANLYVNELSDSPTRSNNRMVKSAVLFANENTRGSESLCGYYIINFEDNEGFAVMGADRRLESLYAINDSGNLNLSDTINNEGLAVFFNSLPKSLDDLDITSTDSEITRGPMDPPTPISGVEVAPLLNLSVRKWGQGAPFNQYCPLKNNQRTKVGCGPLAAGMLMSYFEWPTKYNGYSFNWSVMKSNSSSTDIARLLKEIGNSENMNTNYGTEGSGSDPANFVRTFTNMGYKSVTRTAFNEAMALRQLRAKKPIIMHGEGNYLDRSGGHGWVVDGIYWTKYPSTTAIVNPGETVKYEYKYYLHCVWGWSGDNNGYFSFSNNQISGYAIANGSDEDPHKNPIYFNKIYMVYGFVKN